MLEGLTSVQRELTVSTDRDVSAVPVLRVIEELMQSVKVGNRDECVRVTHDCSGELTVSTDREVTAVSVQRAIEGLMESVKVGNRDKCSRGTHKCSGGANCINRQRSYSCTCPEGYRWINGVCQGR